MHTNENEESCCCARVWLAGCAGEGKIPVEEIDGLPVGVVRVMGGGHLAVERKFGFEVPRKRPPAEEFQ